MRAIKPLLIVVIFTILTIAGCAPMERVTQASVTPPVIPTTAALTITPTLTPFPQPVLTEIANQPLNEYQRKILEDAASKFIATDEAGATRVARDLGYIGVNANPATMCGPLSIRILQDAGLMDTGVDLLDFFYLDPRPGADYSRLEKIFPKLDYDWLIFDQAINKIDFSLDPLYAGDFLYLFAGDSGSFEHMLVVTRVDEGGRAYSVTNFNNGNEVVIEEVMLYDPAKPGEGQFYKWTDWENRAIGRTGYGGMWVWRRKVNP